MSYNWGRRTLCVINPNFRENVLCVWIIAGVKICRSELTAHIPSFQIKSWKLNIEFLGFLKNPGWEFARVRRDGQMGQEADLGSRAREREEIVRTVIPAAPSCSQGSAIHPAQLILCFSSSLGGCPQNTNPQLPHFHFSALHPSRCKQADLCAEQQLDI